MSPVGVVTAVTSAITGAVVSVLELLVDSSFSPQEMIVRLKMDMRIICKILFIFSFTSNERK